MSKSQQSQSHSVDFVYHKETKKVGGTGENLGDIAWETSQVKQVGENQSSQ